MKKLVILFVTISLALSFAGCERSNTPTNSSPSSKTCSHMWRSATCTTPKTCSLCEETIGVSNGHNWKNATCTEARKCTVCGISSGNPLGHTTSTGICSRCGTKFSPWEKGNYVDEFQNPTDKKYIICDANGTFSNSATTNSTLSASLQIDLSNIGIMLWEYNSHLVKGIYDYENYSISILDNNGTKHTFTGTIYQGGTRIYFSADDRDSVISLLLNNSEIEIYVKSTKYSISTYLFTINCIGFSEAYSSLT